MLILTRRVGEVLVIGDAITVQVLAVNGNQVRFGVVAPRDTDVHREEIYKRIQAERKGERVPREDQREARFLMRRTGRSSS